MKYYKRQMEKRLKELARSYYVLVICGPRQSGKSTLVQKLFKNHDYVSLEDPDERLFASQDPRGFLAQFQKKVIIDEVQNVPQIFSYIQGIVDKKKIKAQFVLTGSSHFNLIEGVSQSLAGRSAVFELLPLSQSELSKTPSSLEEIILKGGYPSIHFNRQPITDWYKDYCKNYVEKDIRKLLNIRHLNTFQLFLKMCAARCGQIINYSSIANDCGIATNTVKEWINILEASFIIYRLNPYYKNYSKRLIKSPKLYFYDTGIACHLLEIQAYKQLITHPMRGYLFESWVISEFKKSFYNQHRNAPLYYWRTSKGIEVDVIIDKGNKFNVIEIKSGKTIHPSFFKNIDYFNDLTKEKVSRKYLIYAGTKLQIRNKIKILPWSNIDEITKNSQ